MSNYEKNKKTVPFSVKANILVNSCLLKGLVIILCSLNGTSCFFNQARAFRHDVQLGDKNNVIMLFTSFFIYNYLTLLYKKNRCLKSAFLISRRFF